MDAFQFLETPLECVFSDGGLADRQVDFPEVFDMLSEVFGTFIVLD